MCSCRVEGKSRSCGSSEGKFYQWPDQAQTTSGQQPDPISLMLESSAG